MTRIFAIWRESLQTVMGYYERRRGSLATFYPLLFVFFVLLNIGCYWWAIYTAFPIYMQTAERPHYLMLQFPIGFLGALFDSLSFFITIWIIRRALAAKSSMEYVMHLSLDLVIAGQSWHAFDADAAAMRADQGFSFLPVGSDSTFLAAAAQNLVSVLRP